MVRTILAILYAYFGLLLAGGLPLLVARFLLCLLVVYRPVEQLLTPKQWLGVALATSIAPLVVWCIWGQCLGVFNRPVALFAVAAGLAWACFMLAALSGWTADFGARVACVVLTTLAVTIAEPFLGSVYVYVCGLEIM